MTRAAQKKAVEQRTQQRLAARKEAAKKGAETRRRKRDTQLAEVATKKAALKKHEAELVAETRKMLDAEAAAQTQEQQPEVHKRQRKRPERNVAQTGLARPGGQASGAMVTVALRGESAQRLRALAAAQKMSLSKLLVRMMEVFEAAAK